MIANSGVNFMKIKFVEHDGSSCGKLDVSNINRVVIKNSNYMMFFLGVLKFIFNTIQLQTISGETYKIQIHYFWKNMSIIFFVQGVVRIWQPDEVYIS